MSIYDVKPFLSPPTLGHEGVIRVPGRKRSYITPVDEKTIGRRIRELRQQRGLTQVQLAEMAGVEQSLVSDYERGIVRLHGALVAAFARALKVSADEILTLEPVKNQRNGLIKDRRFARRLQLIDQLSRRQKDALLTTIDTFLKGAGLNPHVG